MLPKFSLLFYSCHYSVSILHIYKDLFLSILNCVKTGDVYITFIGEIQCYYGFHFLHVFCSVVVTIVFVLICLICALTFFECSDEEGDLTAKYFYITNRENSRADFVMLISKIISILIMTFLSKVF